MTQKNWKSLQKKLNSFLIFFVLAFPLTALAKKTYRADEAPKALQDITVKEHLGSSIDLNLIFTDENNKSGPLKKYFNEKPILMSIIYYNCPSLCNFHLNGLFEGLNQLSPQWNKSYELIIVSMDESEKAPLAQEKKQNYLKKFTKLQAKNIHFMTGSKTAITKLAGSLGFSFRWDEETEQFAHSPVAYALSPKGLISRYLYGVLFSAKKLKLSLLEAGEGKIGNMIDRILLFCYRFNPKENKYTLYSANLMKAGGAFMVFILMILLIPTWIRERRKHS